MRRILALTLLLPGVAVASLPPGGTVDPAVLVDFTPAGLDNLEVIAQGLIPDSIPLPDPLFASQGDECGSWPFDWACIHYNLTVSNFVAGLALEQLEVTPQNGFIDVELVLDVSVSSSSSPGRIEAWVNGDLSIFDLDLVDQRCNVWMDPTPITVGTSIAMNLVPVPNGSPTVNVEIASPTLAFDLDGFNIDGCLLGGLDEFLNVIDDVLNFFNVDLEALLISAIQPALQGTLDGLLDTLETTVEDIFSALVLSQELALGETVLTVDVAPSRLAITPAGLRLGLAGSVDPGPFPAECVSQYVTAGSLETGTGTPTVGEGADVYDHHLGLFVDDDFVNSLMYGLWYGGLLCVDLSDAGGFDLPIPIDTSLLGLLAPGHYDELFPETAPLQMKTRPEGPPIATMAGNHDIDLTVDTLGLDLYAGLDGRMTRVVGFDIDADVGVDLDFDGVSGMLALLIDFDPATALALSVGYNELRPESSTTLETGIGGIVNSFLGPLLGDLLGGIEFGLPSFAGLGLDGLAIGAAGDSGDFLGVYATLGLVNYENEFDPEAGCTGGCEGGCTQGGPGGTLVWFLPLILAGARRRT